MRPKFRKVSVEHDPIRMVSAIASGAQLLQGDAGVDAQIFLEMTPGLAAQAFQRLDFIREKPLLHRQFDVEDFQALLRDHPVTEFWRVSA